MVFYFFVSKGLVGWLFIKKVLKKLDLLKEEVKYAWVFVVDVVM